MSDLTQSTWMTQRVRRWAAAAAVLTAAVLGASQVQARDVQWSVGVSSPGVSVNASTAPVYVTPAPVYVVTQPPRRPVYHAPPVPVYYVPAPPRPRYERERRGRGHGHRSHHDRDDHRGHSRR